MWFSNDISCFLAVVRFPYENSRLLVLVQRTFVGGLSMGNMLRRGESSWLCMKFELAFFAGATILDQVSELLLVFGFCLLAPPELVRTAPG